MSTTHDDFEEQLRTLTPRQPARRLESAIARALDESPVAFPRVKLPKAVWWSLVASWTLTAAAASVAVALYLSRPADAKPGEEPHGTAGVPVAATDGRIALKPVDAREFLYGARYEGIVFLDDGSPARRMRYQYLDTVKMRAEGESASVAMTYPREEIRFVPINAY